MHLFQQPGVSIINPATILCYRNVCFSTFKISWNTYFLYYLCYIWPHEEHVVDCSIALIRSDWLFPMSFLWVSTHCWSRSWASQNCVWQVTPRLFIHIPKASWMPWAMHRKWFLNAGHSILVASRADFDQCVSSSNLRNSYLLGFQGIDCQSPQNNQQLASNVQQSVLQYGDPGRKNLNESSKSQQTGLSTSAQARCTFQKSQFQFI